MKQIYLTFIGVLLFCTSNFSQVEINATGISNNFSINYPANIPALTAGLSFTFKANHTISGPTFLNVNSLGNVSIKKEVSQDLEANDIQFNQIVTVVFDGTNFQMTSKAGTSGSGSSAAGSDGDVQFNTGGVLNGSAALRWDNTNQRLGVGTNAPQDRLDIQFGNVLMDDGYNIIWGITPAPYVQGNDASDYLAFGTSGGERLRINSSGNVGIGTSAPSQRLDVVGTFKLTDGTEAAGYVLTSDAAGNASWQLPSGGSSAWIDAGADVYLNDLTDYVGIGTNAPSEKLSIGAFGNATSTGTQIGSERIALTGAFWNGGSEVLHNITLENVASTVINEAGHLSIGWNGAELMGVHSDGNVGIGTSTPTSKLDIQAVSAGTQLSIKNSSGALRHMFVINGGDNAIYQMSDATNIINTQISASLGSPSFFIGSNVGIGTSNPNSTFSIEGSHSQSLFTFNSGSITLDDTHYNVIYNNTSGSVSVILPPANTCPGRVYRISKIAVTGIVQVQRTSGADFIDNIQNTYVIQSANSVRGIEIISDGVNNWFIVNKFN